MGRERAVGLEPGDRFLTLNGERVRRFDQIKLAPSSATRTSDSPGVARRSMGGKWPLRCG